MIFRDLWSTDRDIFPSNCSIESQRPLNHRNAHDIFQIIFQILRQKNRTIPQRLANPNPFKLIGGFQSISCDSSRWMRLPKSHKALQQLFLLKRNPPGAPRRTQKPPTMTTRNVATIHRNEIGSIHFDYSQINHPRRLWLMKTPVGIIKFAYFCMQISSLQCLQQS